MPALRMGRPPFSDFWTGGFPSNCLMVLCFSLFANVQYHSKIIYLVTFEMVFKTSSLPYNFFPPPHLPSMYASLSRTFWMP